jgi:hypothetical protein
VQSDTYSKQTDYHRSLLLSNAAAAVLLCSCAYVAVAAVVGLLYAVPTHSLLSSSTGATASVIVITPHAIGERTNGPCCRWCNFHFIAGSVFEFLSF